MPETAVETKPAAEERPNPPAPDGAKPEGAAPAGGGETAAPASAPSNEPDWKKEAEGLKARMADFETRHQAALRGMNEAQQRAAFYERQAQALVNVQPKQEDPVEVWSREAEELEGAYRFAEAAPIRSRITSELSRRAAREEFQRLNQQQSMSNTQAAVGRILKEKFGLDPSLAADLSAKAAATPEAIAQAMAMAHDPELVTKVTLREVEERKKASERASLTSSFGGGSGGRGIPGNGNTQKPRMHQATYAALPQSRKDEIKAMALEGKIDLYTVTGKGASERVEPIDPRDL